MSFVPVQKKRIYEDIVKQILEKIDKGTLKPYDKLPPEREMANLLNTSRNSVSEAYRTLEVMGIVDIRPGGGAFIKETQLESMFTQFSENISDDYKLVLEVLEVRDLIEVELVKIAAHRASDADIDNLKNILERAKDAINKGDNGVEYDSEFHMALAKASNNSIYLLLMNLIKDVLAKSLRKEVASIEGQPVETLEGHEAIFHAINNGDAYKAALSMAEHIDQAKKDYINIMNKKVSKID